ncbi:uncharacterized protein zgc:193726 [Chelmon rostratus]|uniref:uncharacterized protein zgc:193726 n=1 Tax=Chelmon rostratus TaxID=109905 RepID=UPI001BE69E59|nr:uncharacterized protein zgc:193726 [Chelmon rostratus]
MESFQSVPLFMMMMVFISAGPLPPSLNNSRPDDQNTATPHLLNNKEENSTRFEFRQSVNDSLGNVTQEVTSNTWENEPGSPSLMFDLQPERFATYRREGCVLSTCLTANLGSALQGGDETAGGATTDPFGIGKK